jgi:uncharacterized membrane protein YeaQ/YmgE (transglycosylase-associated protein family)
MGIIAWIVLGLVAGILAQILIPAKIPGGIVVTALLGMAGAVLGGFIAAQLGFGSISGFDIRSVVIAVGGAILLLFLFRMFLVRLLFGKL